MMGLTAFYKALEMSDTALLIEWIKNFMLNLPTKNALDLKTVSILLLRTDHWWGGVQDAIYQERKHGVTYWFLVIK